MNRSTKRKFVAIAVSLLVLMLIGLGTTLGYVFGSGLDARRVATWQAAGDILIYQDIWQSAQEGEDSLRATLANRVESNVEMIELYHLDARGREKEPLQKAIDRGRALLADLREHPDNGEKREGG